jgi:hypothetical protein
MAKLLKIINATEENNDYCIYEASDSRAVLECHLAAGIECEWVEKVTTLTETSSSY